MKANGYTWNSISKAWTKVINKKDIEPETAVLVRLGIKKENIKIENANTIISAAISGLSYVIEITGPYNRKQFSWTSIPNDINCINSFPYVKKITKYSNLDKLKTAITKLQISGFEYISIKELRERATWYQNNEMFCKINEKG